MIEARGKSSALSAANSIANHLRDWLSLSPLSSLPRGEDRLNDSGEEEAREMFTPCASRVLSMGVSSDGNPYHVPEGLFFSFPVDCSEGTVHTIPGVMYTVTEDGLDRSILPSSDDEMAP